MLKLDGDFLVNVGLRALPAEAKNRVLRHVYDLLQMRVGERIASELSEEQRPDYREVVRAEYRRLAAELRASALQILGREPPGHQGTAGYLELIPMEAA